MSQFLRKRRAITSELRQNPAGIAIAMTMLRELEKFPDDDYRYVEGRILRMSLVGWQHGKLVMDLGTLLNRYVQDRNLAPWRGAGTRRNVCRPFRCHSRGCPDRPGEGLRRAGIRSSS